MPNKIWHSPAPAWLVLVSVVMAGGCASSSQGEKMVASYSRTRQTLGASADQVEITLVALSRLRQTPGDMISESFKHYKEVVEKLDESGKDARWRYSNLKEEQEDYIRAWQEEMADIKDQAIKSTLESRRAAVRSNFKLVQMYAADVRKTFDPFLDGNKQIVQALSIDLSPAAVSSLAPSIDRVLTDGQKLRERMGAMQQALNNIANGISPLGLSRRRKSGAGESWPASPTFDSPVVHRARAATPYWTKVRWWVICEGHTVRGAWLW